MSKKKDKTTKKKENEKKRSSSSQSNKQQLLEQAARESTGKSQQHATSHSSDSPMTVAQVCDWIAELSEAILEQPDAAFSSSRQDGHVDEEKDTNASKSSPMRQLLQISTTQATPDQAYTAQLAILSLLAIFKDILPSYRIRLPTAQEMAVKVSKDTKKLWNYERALLHHYQQYLQLLEKTWERSKDNPSPLAIASILSICELLQTAWSFNFSSNLLNAVVRQMNNRAVLQVGDACCRAVEHVFCHDAHGEFTLQAVRQVTKLIRDRGFKVRPAVVRTLVQLPLRVHVDEAQAAKLATQANAKKRKRDQERAKIESELRESQATVDKIVLARCQSDMLQAVTLTYFRILKADNLQAPYIQELLPPALEGLAKFAHLINIDTVMDLLAVLKDLLLQVDALPLDAALNCVLTAFETLQGPGKEMKIDQKEYISPLYRQLPRLCMGNDHSTNTVQLALQCLMAAFVKRREYSTVRVAAFFKQILSVALHCPPHTSVPLIAFARQLLQRYPSVQQLLENEQDVITSGEYQPEVQDPEHSNPFATSAWELALLEFHVASTVATQAQAAASMKMLQLPAEEPDKLRASLLQDADELYIPFTRNKRKHPLTPKGGNKDKKRRQARFITPRTTTCPLLEQYEL